MATFCAGKRSNVRTSTLGQKMTPIPVHVNDFTVRLDQNRLGGVRVEAIFPGRDPFRAMNDDRHFVGAVGHGNDGFCDDGWHPDHDLLVVASCMFMFEDEQTREWGSPSLDIWPDAPDPEFGIDYHWGLFRPTGAVRVRYQTFLHGRKHVQTFVFPPIDYTAMSSTEATRMMRDRADTVAAWMTGIRTDRCGQRIDWLRACTTGRLLAQIRWRTSALARRMRHDGRMVQTLILIGSHTFRLHQKRQRRRPLHSQWRFRTPEPTL